ncbi:MAG: MtnX-like HAD-IB family phosphatase [Thermoleophilia bacterium]
MDTLLIACDFDGTITRRDTLHLIVEEFGTRGLWQAVEPRLRSGEVTLEQAMQEEFASVRASSDEVRELVLREAGLRAGFREFVAWSRAAGHRLTVLSSGFRVVIDALLGAWGLEGLPVTSHDAAFSRDGCRIEWSDRGERCAVCGRHCKRHDLAAVRRGEPVVFIGDGVSDRCAALAADVVFARAHLARDLAAAGRPYEPFDDFTQVRRRLLRHPALAA